MSHVGRVLIGGGTGFIGRNLGELLRSHKYEVVKVSRKPRRSTISWDTMDCCADGVPRTNAVVNLAGQKIMDITKPWTEKFKREIYSSRIETTEKLINCINRCETKPEVFILVTEAVAYEPSEVTVHDDDSDIENLSFFPSLCLDWEKAAREVDKSVRLVIIRSGVVLGQQSEIIKNMILPYNTALVGRFGSGKQYLPWIHIDDLTRLILFSIENNKVSGVINGVAPQVITNAEFKKSLAKAFRRISIPVPARLLQLLLHPDRVSMLLKGPKVISTKIKNYGFTFNYDNINKVCEDLAKIQSEKVVSTTRAKKIIDIKNK